MRRARRPANVRRVTDGLDELYQVSQAVLSVTRQMPVRDVLQVIVRSARSLVGARYAALGVPDERDSFAEFVVDGISSAEWHADRLRCRSFWATGCLRRAAQRGQAGNGSRTSAKTPGSRGWPSARTRRCRISSGSCGRATGTRSLGIIFAGQQDLPPRRLLLAGSPNVTCRSSRFLAAHAAIALTNARLYERSQELSVIQGAVPAGQRPARTRSRRSCSASGRTRGPPPWSWRTGQGSGGRGLGSGTRSRSSARSAPKRTPNCVR